MPFNERPEPTVTVVVAADSSRSRDWGDSINIPLARNRLDLFFDRNQGPQHVEDKLAAGLNGNLVDQMDLFELILDTWPRPQKNINEMLRKVVVSPWKVHPHCDPGADTKASAEKLAKEVEGMIWSMRPDVPRLESGFEGLIKNLGLGFYTGHAVEQILWRQRKDQTWVPRSSLRLNPNYYGYPYCLPEGDGQDRLMYCADGINRSQVFIDFPENRFLIGINSGHHGHPSMAAPLRALAFYWLAAVRGLKWMMQFTQRYGIPFIHAKSDDKGVQGRLAQMMQQIGTEGWAVTETGASLEVVASTQSGQSLPQRELLALANEAADTFILGQTLTSGTDNSGSRALGEVHAHTQNEMVDAISDYVGSIFTYQLIPSIVSLNWGEREDLPQLWAKREEQKDEKKASEIMEIKLRMGIPMTESYVYEATNTPIPAEGDKLFEPAKKEEANPSVPPKGEKQQEQPTDDEDPDEVKKEDVKAADASRKSTVDRLADNVGTGLTGVAQEWLAPIKPSLRRLIALAESGQVTDEDFVSELQKMQRAAPEMMDLVDQQGLEEALMSVISTAALAGSTSRYE